MSYCRIAEGFRVGLLTSAMTPSNLTVNKYLLFIISN